MNSKRAKFVGVAGGLSVMLLGWPGTARAADWGKGLEELVSGATYRLEAVGTIFPDDVENPPQVDDDELRAFSRLHLTGQGWVSDELVIKAELYGTLTTGRGDVAGIFSYPDDHSVKAHYLDFKNLSLGYDTGEWALTVGKSQVVGGLSTLYSPADRYRNADVADPMQAIATGLWLVRYERFIGDDTLSLAVMPFDERTRVPSDASRWIGDSGSYTFYSLSLTPGVTSLADEYRDPKPENWSWLATYKMVRSGFDAMFTAAHGKAAFPVVREVGAVGVSLYPDASSLSAAVTSTIDRWELHGEAIYQYAWNGEDESFLRHVIGFMYRENALANRLGMDEIQPVLEYAGEIVTDDQAAGYMSSSFSSRPFRDALLARVVFKINGDWSAEVGGSKNWVDKDASHYLGLEYKYSDNLKFNGWGRRFQGASDTQFGRWRRNGHISLGMEYRF